MTNIVNLFKKRSKLIITSLFIMMLIIVLVLVGKYSRIKYREYKFQEALVEAAKIPYTDWDEKYKAMEIKGKYKAVLVVCDGGELSYADYFKISAEKIGWEVMIFNSNTFGKEKEILDFDPDFILLSNFTNGNIGMQLRAHRSKKFVLNFLPLQTYKNTYKAIEKRDPYEVNDNFSMKSLLENAHGVLTISKELDFYQKISDKLGKPSFDGLRILPLALRLENEPVEPQTVIWGGVGGDSFRYSDKYKQFIKLLSDAVPMKVYGPYRNFSHLSPHVYGGYLMFGMDNIKAIRENGIYLLTHGQFHFDGNVPGLRIFEAVAANAVVISDKLPFAVENFGDSFLYFDREADPEIMYKQVKAHVDWIKANPEKAKAMAAKAHQIFLDHFTLEKDLTRIAKMYEYLVAKDQKMGLNRPFVY